MNERHVYYNGRPEAPLLIGQLAIFKKKIYFEYAYSLMAKTAGIIMPDTRLFEDKHLQCKVCYSAF